MGGKICFSKEMIRTCVRSFPKEIKAKVVEFTCRSRPHAEVLKRRVEAGELVETEDLLHHPLSYHLPTQALLRILLSNIRIGKYEFALFFTFFHFLFLPLLLFSFVL